MRKFSAWFLAATMMVSSVYTPVMAEETSVTDNVVMEETELTQEVQADDDTQQMNKMEDSVEEVLEESTEENKSAEIDVTVNEEDMADNVEIEESSGSLKESLGNIFVEDVNALEAGEVTIPKSWKNLYAELGVDTSEEGEGYYDAVTSATKFTSYHVKDIPSTVNKEKATIDGEEQTVLNGVNLIGKEASITPKLSSASHTDNSKYGTDEFVIVPDDSVEGYVWNDYIKNLYAVTISDGNTTVGAMPWVDFYGESATSGVHYNKIQISLNKGESLGSNKAMVHRYDAFYGADGNLKPGDYTVTVYAEGFKPLTAKIEVCEYEYMYAALTWDEYWANEGVFAAGSTDSCADKDDHDELDKGAFDAVTRATTVHGVHRGSYQCSATIFDTAGKNYELSHWSDDGKIMYFNDGSSAAWNRGVMTFDDGSTATMNHYTLNGIKYVPVRIAKKDVGSFKAAYKTVANGDFLKGGYGEVNLSAYNLKAAVDKTTNGLKTVTRNTDGTFTFSAAASGKGSGTEEAQKTVDMNNLTVTVKNASGSYGEFLRVDLTGSEYGGLGSKMYAVTWKYFGNTDPSTNMRAKALATYGTKFAADNWMHKSNGIQLGLTESGRCQLPDGTDGTGYWQIVVKAMGYSDTSINFQVTETNLVKKQVAADTTVLEEKYKEAAALNEADYTADSWKNFKTEYEETKDLLNRSDLKQSEVDEQLTHLNQAMNNLLKKSAQTITTSATVYKKIYGQKTFNLGAKADGKLTYSSSNAKVVVVAANGNATIKGVGTAKITIKAAATDTCKAETKTVTVTVSKAAQPLKVKIASKTIKVKKIKKKAVKFNIGASSAIGKVTYKSSNKKVKVTSKGVITVKKGTKKGKYKITVTAAGNAYYNAGRKIVTIIVK